MAEFRGAGSDGGRRITKVEEDVLNPLRLGVRNARNERRDTRFDQRLGDARTALSLGQIGDSDYLRFLRAEQSTLQRKIAGLKKTSNGYRQATDQLNEISGLIKEVEESFNGQFNLGDIQLPSVYDVRRYVQAGGPGAAFLGSNSAPVNGATTQITINGANTGQILEVLAEYIGGNVNYTVGGY